MVTDFDRLTSKSRRASAWFIAEYAVLERRLDLINRYNETVGPPSPGVLQVQNDFIRDRMDPGELVAFVQVCEGLITAVHNLESSRR